MHTSRRPLSWRHVVPDEERAVDQVATASVHLRAPLPTERRRAGDITPREDTPRRPARTLDVMWLDDEEKSAGPFFMGFLFFLLLFALLWGVGNDNA